MCPCHFSFTALFCPCFQFSFLSIGFLSLNRGTGGGFLADLEFSRRWWSQMGLATPAVGQQVRVRQPQREPRRCRMAVDTADLWRALRNFSSLHPCDFFSYLLLNLKSHRYNLLVAFCAFSVVGGSVKTLGLVLEGIETERETYLGLKDLCCYILNKILLEFCVMWEFGTESQLYPPDPSSPSLTANTQRKVALSRKSS